MERPTKDELEREAFEEELRCVFHAEMVFEDGDEEGAVFLCPAKGCDEKKVVTR